jgi:hypothetical protein
MKYILDKILEKIDKIGIYRHYYYSFFPKKKEDKDKENLCCICFDKMNPSCPTLFKCIVCLHSIHSNCIKKWVDIKHGIKVTCPLCRFPISLATPMKKNYSMDVYAFFLGFSIPFIEIIVASFYLQGLPPTTTLSPLSSCPNFSPCPSSSSSCAYQSYNISSFEYYYVYDIPNVESMYSIYNQCSVVPHFHFHSFLMNTTTPHSTHHL